MYSESHFKLSYNFPVFSFVSNPGKSAFLRVPQSTIGRIFLTKRFFSLYSPQDSLGKPEMLNLDFAGCTVSLGISTPDFQVHKV